MVDLRKPCGLGARATVECLRRHGYPPWRTRTHDAEPGVRADPPASGFFSYECPAAAGRSTRTLGMGMSPLTKSAKYLGPHHWFLAAAAVWCLYLGVGEIWQRLMIEI